MEDDIYAILSHALRTHTQVSIDAAQAPAPAPAPAYAQAPQAPVQAPQQHAPAPAQALSPETADNMMSHEHGINEFIASKSRDFDKLIPTTFGLNGSLVGVVFEESILIKHIEQFLAYPCVRAVCNDGTASVADFDERVKSGQIDMSAAEKSERQHAKKQERAHNKTRKMRGDGKSFNSSILFWIHSARFGIVYKIRLFRNGRFGLPGTRPDMVDDIICLRDRVLIPILARALQAAYNMPELPRIIAGELVPIMKNYKWRRMLPDGAIINLRQVAARTRTQSHQYPSPPFNVAYAQYGIDDTKLSIKFATPITDNPDKAIRVKIFPSGKINILGAHCAEITKKICEYVIAILDDSVIVAGAGGDDNFSEIEESSPSDGEFADAFARSRSAIDEMLHRALI